MALQIKEKAEIKPHVFTLEEYDRLCEAGVFDEDARVELIRGVIVDMPPPGPEHDGSSIRLHLVFYEQMQRHAVIAPQGNTVAPPGQRLQTAAGPDALALA